MLWQCNPVLQWTSVRQNAGEKSWTHCRGNVKAFCPYARWKLMLAIQQNTECLFPREKVNFFHYFPEKIAFDWSKLFSLIQPMNNQTREIEIQKNEKKNVDEEKRRQQVASTLVEFRSGASGTFLSPTLKTWKLEIPCLQALDSSKTNTPQRKTLQVNYQCILLLKYWICLTEIELQFPRHV